MNKHVSMKKKVLSFFLAFVILFSSMPAELFTFAFASVDNTGASTPAVSVELTTDPPSSASGESVRISPEDKTDAKLKINVTLAENVDSAEVAITLSEDAATLIDMEELREKYSAENFSLSDSDHKLRFTATESNDYEIPLQYPDAEPAEDKEQKDIALKIDKNDVSVTVEEKEPEQTPETDNEGTEEQQPGTETGGSDNGETGQENPGTPSEETTPGIGDATQPPSEGGSTDPDNSNTGDGNSDGNTPTTTPTTPETDGAITDQNPVDDVVDTVVESMSVQAANAAEDNVEIDADVNLLFKAPAQPTEEGPTDDENNPGDEGSPNGELVLTISNTSDTLTITDGTLSDLSFKATATVDPEKFKDQTELSFDFDIKLPTGITADEAQATLGEESSDAEIKHTYNEGNNTLTLTITQPLETADASGENDVTPAARSGEENSWSYDITVTGLKVSDDFAGGDITINADGSSEATTIQIEKEEPPVNENAFYNLSVSAEPTALSLNADNVLDDFTITANAEKIADKNIPEGTNEFSFTLSIDLPKGISLPDGEVKVENNIISAGDTQIAEISLPEGASVTSDTSGPLTFTITQSTEKLTDGTPLTYSVAFSGSALTVDADTLTETAEITATATPSGAQGNAGSTAITVSTQAEEQGEAAISYTLQLSKDAEFFAPVERKLPAFDVDASATMTNPENYKEETFTFNIVLQLPEGTTLPKEKTSVKDMIVYADGFLLNNTTIFEMTGDSGATIGDVTYEAASGTLTIPITQPVNPTDSEETEPETKTGDNINERSWNYNLAFQADVFTLADNVGASTLSAYISTEDNATVIGTKSSLAIAAETAQLPENTQITATTTPTQTVLWYDNNNADSKRPGIDAFTLDNTPIYFKVKDGEWEQLTFANMKEAGLGEMPTLAVENSGSNAYTLSVKDLPAEIKIFSEDGTTVLDTTTIKWSFSPNGEASKAKPPAMDGYEATVNDEGEWVYTYLTDIVFTVELDWGTLGERVNGVRTEAGHLVLENFVLNGEEGSTPVTLQSLKEQGKLDYVVTEGTSTDQPTTFTFTIKDQPMYSNTNSALINYNVDVRAEKEPAENEDIKFELPSSLTDEDKDDYLVATYDNTHAVNHNSDTDAIYPGGTLNLRLTGETTFEAKKVWLDWETWNENKVNRPNLTFELWRYREDALDGEVAPVKDASNKVITIELSSEESANYKPQADIDLRIEDGNDNLLSLDKDDSDGYRYIYFLKEIVNAEAGDNTYEQVFGRVGRDLGQGEVEIEGDALPLKHAQIYQGKKERRSDDICLYNGGVLSNRLSGTRQVELTKKWNAAAYQGYMENVSVEYTLQVQYLDSTEDAGKWYNAYPEVTRTQENITEENMAYWHTSATVPNVGPLGRDVAYRWAETAVYQNGKEVTSQKDDYGRVTRFTLIQNDQKVQYSVEYTDPLDDNQNPTGNTTIENSIADTINYDVTKVWEDGTDPEEVTFNLYRLPSGSALTDSTPVYLKFTLDGDEAKILDPVPDDFKGNIGVDEKESSVEAHNKTNKTENWKDNWQETWRTVINDLPRYDAEGRAYEYVLLESNEDSQEHFPIYTTEHDPQTGDYETQVINPAPGKGNRIMVRKEWNDDSDSAHRGAVTINVYAKNPKEGDDAKEPIADVTLKDDVWMQEVHIGEYEADEVYILETKVGGTNVPLQPYTFGGENGPDYKTPEAPESTDVYQYQTAHHRYEATYSKTQVSGEDIFIVNNRRLGNIDLTVTKTWNDGEGQLRDALQKANDELGNAAIYPYLELKFADGYTADGRVIEDNTVTLTQGSSTDILDNEGNPASSLQQLHLDLQGDTATEKVYFFNLPKYDKSGAVASYTVKEVWITGSGESEKQITSKAALKEYFETNLPSDYEGKTELLELLDEFSTSVKQDSYTSKDEATVDGTIPHDDQQMTVTNGLGNTKDVVWYKHWNDQYVFDQNQRPDIYIDVYRVVHDKEGNVRVELVKQDYRWDPRPVSTTEDDDTVSEEIDPNSWRVTMYDVQKYDALGYEIQYYAIERTLIDYPSYDYVVGDYYKTNDLNFSEENYLGTADEIKTGGESYVLNFAAMQDKFDDNIDPTKVLSPDYAANALKEGGMFVNSLDDQVAFQGQKIWQAESMPDGYDDINLPAVTFELYRTTKSADEVKDDNGKMDYSKMDKFATQTVTDWASAHQNGTYVFTFMEKDAYGNDTDKALELPRYDAEGNVYTYYMREASAELGENGPALEDVFTVSDPESNTYVATNIYNPPKGEIYVQKHLQLPDGMTENDVFPSIQFTLTRTYAGKNADGTNYPAIEDKSFSKTIEWDWQNVKQAYAAAKVDATGGTITLTNDKLKFENLPIYAPNGSKYIYTVTERIDEFLYGYTVEAGEGKLAADAESGYESGFGEASPNVSGLEPVETTESEGSEPETQNGDDQSSTEKSWATFKNTFAQQGITLKGEKQWTDYNNAFGVRPDLDTLKQNGTLDKLFTVSRSADGQDAQGNPIGSQTLTVGKDYKIEWTESGNIWSFTITGPGDGEDGKLDAYAPNGMPWKYTVTENMSVLDGVVQEVYKANPRSITVSAGAEITEDDSELTFGSKLNNTMSAGIGFKKIWKDKAGNEITDNHLSGNLTVTFKAQVKEEGSDTWTDAATYFANPNNLSELNYQKIFKDDNEAFEKSITDSVTSAMWKNGTAGKFETLPAVIMKPGESGFTHLNYRVVETKVQYNGTEQMITLNNDGKSYTVNPDNGIVSGAELSEDGLITTNTLDLGSLTITKKWEGDNQNEFATRPSPGGGNYSWVTYFVIEKQTGGDSWDWITAPGSGNPQVFALHGTDTNDQLSFKITGLTKGTYRVWELQPDYNADGTINSTDYVKDSFYNGTYSTEYSAESVNSVQKPNMEITVTNKLKSIGKSISVVKNWQPEGSTPTGASIQAMLQYSNDSGTTWTTLDTVTLNADKNWTYTWNNLPAKYPANATTDTTQYQVVEGAVTGADDYMKLPVSSETNDDKNVSYTITNVKKTSFDVEKKWAGVSVDQQKEIIVQLFSQIEGQTATPVEGKTLTLNSENNWKGTLRDLPAYNEDGAKYTYFAKETTTGDFVPSYVNGGDSDNGFTTTITNIGKLDINGTKTWGDNNNAYGTRPTIESLTDNDPTNDGLTLVLSRTTKPDAENAEWAVVPDATPTWTQSETGNIWNYSYTDLPATDDDGNKYTYKVEEILPPDSEYEGKQDGNNFTNTLEQNISVSGTKTWHDAQRTGRPADLTLTLYQKLDGSEEDWAVVENAEPVWTNQEYDVWSYSYDNLPKYDADGVLYLYKVEETVPDGYDGVRSPAADPEDAKSAVYEYDFDNYKRGALEVTKSVSGNRGDKSKDFHFTVTLSGTSSNGEFKSEEFSGTYGDMTFTKGVATFTLKHGETKTALDLPAGLQYAVVEEEANKDGYTTTSSADSGTINAGYKATAAFNNHRHHSSGGGNDKTKVSVEKEWVTNNGGTPAASVQVQLYRDGKAYGDPVTLNAGNGWSHDWTQLDANHVWTVKEVGVTDGFNVYIDRDGNTIVLVNNDIGGPDPEEPPDEPTDIPDPEKPEEEDPPKDPDDPTDTPDDPTDTPDDPTDTPDEPDKPSTDVPDTEKPNTPSNPSNPSNPSTPSHSTTPGTSGTTTTTTTDKSDDKDAPQTGDNTHIRALFALCLASLAGMTVIGVSRKRQRKDDSDQS